MEPVPTTLILKGVEWPIVRLPFSWCLGKGGWPLSNTIVVCPICLDHWLKFITPYESIGWSVLDWPCETCPVPKTWSYIPGSLLEIPGTGAFDENLLDVLPETLLRREFDLTMRHLT